MLYSRQAHRDPLGVAGLSEGSADPPWEGGALAIEPERAAAAAAAARCIAARTALAATEPEDPGPAMLARPMPGPASATGAACARTTREAPAAASESPPFISWFYYARNLLIDALRGPVYFILQSS